MKVIELFQLLEESKAVIIDDETVVYPSMIESILPEDVDEDFCLFSWEFEGDDYEVRLNGHCDPTVESVENGIINVNNTVGVSYSIQLLGANPILFSSECVVYTAEDGQKYTSEDILRIACGCQPLATAILNLCEWQHPETILDEMLREDLGDSDFQKSHPEIYAGLKTAEGQAETRDIVILEDGDSCSGVTGSVISSITEKEHDDLCEGGSLSQIEREFDMISVSELLEFTKAVSRLSTWKLSDGNEPTEGLEDSHQALMTIIGKSRKILQG